jgi:hypothetical protein
MGDLDEVKKASNSQITQSWLLWHAALARGLA